MTMEIIKRVKDFLKLFYITDLIFQKIDVIAYQMQFILIELSNGVAWASMYLKPLKPALSALIFII